MPQCPNIFPKRRPMKTIVWTFLYLPRRPMLQMLLLILPVHRSPHMLLLGQLGSHLLQPLRQSLLSSLPSQTTQALLHPTSRKRVHSWKQYFRLFDVHSTCYPELFQLSHSIVQTPNTRHLIILGNPGIGKTYFGYFLLLQLALSGATVVYENALEGTLYLLSPDGVKEGNRQALLPYLRSSSTYYIVDGMQPL
jgi:hypothetical protein